jgi:hypothetical protein
LPAPQLGSLLGSSALPLAKFVHTIAPTCPGWPNTVYRCCRLLIDCMDIQGSFLLLPRLSSHVQRFRDLLNLCDLRSPVAGPTSAYDGCTYLHSTPAASARIAARVFISSKSTSKLARTYHHHIIPVVLVPRPLGSLLEVGARQAKPLALNTRNTKHFLSPNELSALAYFLSHTFCSHQVPLAHSS